MEARPRTVFMLEDDHDDRYITESIIEDLGLDIKIVFFSNSNLFLQHLSFAENPSLILLDYNSTPDNGLTVLKKIKAGHTHKNVPVIILSDSNVAKYKYECYGHGACSFIQKPSQVDRTRYFIEQFFIYWFTIAEV
jgi:DNA-binding NtrC family response regulator